MARKHHQKYPVGAFLRAVGSGRVYRVIARGKAYDLDNAGDTVVRPGKWHTLEPYGHCGASVMCSQRVLDARFECTVDPRGSWPFSPPRHEVERLQGQHGVRGIVGHETLGAAGWRSVDERARELELPLWKPLMWSTGRTMRLLWKDRFATDPILVNVPKTAGGSGNHQKVMYPPGWFWLLDRVLRRAYRHICHVARGNGEALSDDAVESAYQARSKDYERSAAYRRRLARQRAADRLRIQTWVEELKP